MNRRINIVAHRGGTKRGPENTLCAFKRAVEDGADGFECDVALTKDDQPVVIHKSFYTDRITTLIDQRGRLRNLTWKELSRMRTNGQRIPHLDDVLCFLMSAPIECFIEPKAVSLKLISEIVSSVSQHGVEHRVHLITFLIRKNLLYMAKGLNPKIATSVILISPFGDWRRKAHAACADMVVPGWKSINHLRTLSVFGVNLQKQIDKTHAAGIPVYSGIADDEQTVNWLCSLGVRGIFTNNVPLARRVASNFESDAPVGNLAGDWK